MILFRNVLNYNNILFLYLFSLYLLQIDAEKGRIIISTTTDEEDTMIASYINNLGSPWNVLVWIALVIGVFAICILITKLNNAVFKRVQRKNPGLHVMFLQHLITIIIIIGFIVLVISSFAGVQTIWTTLFGGTAIISAVLAFAAQDVIKDVLAGMMISAHRPFKVGDRIVLEDGTTGVVEDVTLRHVVLKSTESLRFVVPNHVINGMRLTNYSYKTITRSATFKFSVGYDSNMKLVKRVIARAIESSEYTVEGYIDRNGYNHYGEVYFVAFADSALILQVNVYYLPTTPTEKVIDDINTRVREALIANNIEIPYNYVNVVAKPEEPAAPKSIEKAPVKVENKPVVSAKKAVAKPVTAVRRPVKVAVKSAEKTPVKSAPKSEAKSVVKPAADKPAAKAEPKPAAKAEAKPAVKTEAKPAVKSAEKTPAKEPVKVAAKPAEKATVKPEAKVERKPKANEKKGK